MNGAALLSYLPFGGLLILLSAAATWMLRRQRRFLDMPNARSSHAVPTPRSGGLAIVATAFAGVAALYALTDTAPAGEPYFLGFVVGNAVIVAVSLIDDWRAVGFRTKLAAQTACALAALWFGLVVETLPVPFLGPVDLGWAGYALTLLWIVGLTNAFNFMDGLDGLAGGTAAIVGLFFALIAWRQGGQFVSLASLVVAAACLGFLVFNFPPASIFMGDAGSQFIGFFFAVLALVAARPEAGDVPFLVMPLLFFHFLWDTAFTLVRRWRAGEDITQGHRGHLYQLFNRLGFSHRRVSLYHYGVTAMQGLAALALVGLADKWRLLVFLPFVGWQTAYTVAVARAARRRGLIP